MDQPGAGAHASLAATGASIEEAYPVAGGRDVEADVPALQAKVARAERDGHNYFYLWLDNGHIWREKEKSRFRYKEGTEITISKGALGANHLRVSGRSGMVLVERVK